ncbi:type II toxin-antitoxin system HicA family toxin [Stenomitos frigidus]|uniref:Type II toxin-antitoxin system HicA family toxin n=1 Tax=Stenomitos frigidus ULC18 TaxID=2107698 RepID=A0A2T1DTH8_9CYAN|nr:type II toxin-antitoxin system HicA family toxin [Stenomitos frigidus]PSB23785.1 type II toxin-antitoxin system HicA family toxin [Stenomitos frigidus ULC18]
MPKLKRLSGAQVITILETFGFQIYSQKGSHVKLRRIRAAGNETLIVPNHKQLDTGTCRALLKQVSQYIPEEELAPYFYNNGE